MSKIGSALVAVLTAIAAVTLTHYMDTQVPEGVPEVWNARILDAALRTNGKLILSLHDLGVPGGITWWTRAMVSTVLKTLITGSPFGKGNDPELKITDTEYAGVPVRVYEPQSLSGEGRRPVMVYYHGGGWSWLDVDVYDASTRELAMKVPMVLVSVGYRQSPEHAHPIPLEDCLRVTEYVIKHADDLQLDPKRVSIAGDSAGGHLTAAVALQLREKIKIQVPIYPCLQLLDLQTPSYIENRNFIPGMLNDVSMLSYWMNYGNISYQWMPDFLANNHTSPELKRSKYASRISPKWYMPEHIRTESLRRMDKRQDFGDSELSQKYESVLLDPLFAPLMADDKEYVGLPLTYVLTAGYDVLRDDGLIYAQRLKKAGVNVHLAHYQEGFHGMIFFFDGPIAFDVGKRAMQDLVSFLQENL
ncbi:neutral cholesterol ester hydrolase 1 [Aplysia californica]|uniref:Neutral cholesterol ester hydrolase 1 n=1 Tax=Aplysia californica TaxID=6500 RepID=A0ABM0K5P7_APLCA|nr:neutral cholesterol ester hydrolase 1 [Aplysia californica]